MQGILGTVVNEGRRAQAMVELTGHRRGHPREAWLGKSVRAEVQGVREHVADTTHPAGHLKEGIGQAPTGDTSKLELERWPGVGYHYFQKLR